MRYVGTVTNAKGQEIRKTFEAPNEDELRRRLKKEGFEIKDLKIDGALEVADAQAILEISSKIIFGIAILLFAAIVFSIVIPGNILSMYLFRRAPGWLLQPILIFVPFIGLIIGSFASGAIGGESLKRGLRTSLGFGSAFLIPGLASPLILFLNQGWIGKANSERILFFATAFGLAFFLGGAVGGLFLKKGSRTAFSIGAGFGAGGICGGIIMSIYFIYRSNFHGWTGIPTLIAGWLLPYFIGGSFLGKLLRKENS